MMGPFAAALAVIVAMAPWSLDLTRRGRRVDEPARRWLPPRSTRSWRWPGRRRPDPTSQWIDVLDRLARATSTGRSLAQALTEEADRPDAPADLRRHGGLRQAGASTSEAFEALGPPSDPDARLALAVLAAASKVGGPPSVPIDRASAVLRERRAGAGERAVGAAQSRLSAQVLSALPVVVTAWTLTTDPTLRHVLLGTPIGLACLAVGALLDLAGWRWMGRIVGAS